MKKNDKNCYKEHVHYILYNLSGISPPQLSIQNEEILRTMFKEIQTPFMMYCPSYRKNFLSYSYIFHKFFQLLNMDHLLIYFPLLKNTSKLHTYDVIWKKICQYKKWQYIPSI